MPDMVPPDARTPQVILFIMNINIEKTLEFDGVKVTIKKMPMRKLAGLLDVLKELPQDVKTQIMGLNFDTMSNEEFMSQIPSMVALLMPELAHVVARACNSDVKKEVFLDELGLDDNIAVIETILEVNKIQSVLERVKKIKALYQSTKATPMVPVKNT